MKHTLPSLIFLASAALPLVSASATDSKSVMSTGPAVLTSATTGAAYSQSFTVAGGAPPYTWTTISGYGGGSSASFAPGTSVTISANAAPAGQVFKQWTGNAPVADSSSPTTTLTMPSSSVTTTSTYYAPAPIPQLVAAIRSVFLQWEANCLNAYTTGGDHPSSVGAVNSASLLPAGNAYRMAASNYYLGHARSVTMMSLCIDPAVNPAVPPQFYCTREATSRLANRPASRKLPA